MVDGEASKSPRSRRQPCVVSVRLTSAIVEKIDAIAAVSGTSRSGVVRFLLAERAIAERSHEGSGHAA